MVLLGGGEYACVFANASYAMDSLGADGSLVTSTRPMSLKDTPLNPLRNFQWYVYVRVRRYCFVFFYCMYEFETNIVIVAIYSLWHIDVYIFTKTHHFHPISTLVNSRLSWHLNLMFNIHYTGCTVCTVYEVKSMQCHWQSVTMNWDSRRSQ